MRRIQMDIDEKLDEAVADEAARRGISKSELFEHVLPTSWRAQHLMTTRGGRLIGWRDDDPIADIDEVVYGPAK